MPIGTPDWSRAGLSANVVASFDVAELAARLASPVNYDRTGKTVHIDTFEHVDGLVTLAASGAAVAPARDTAVYEFGGGSVKTTLNIGASNYTQILKFIRTWEGERLSVEIAFVTLSIPDKVLIDFYHWYNTVGYLGSIYLDNGCTEFTIEDGTLGTTVIESFSGSILRTYIMNIIKIVMNPTTGMYVKGNFNSHDWDLSDYELQPQASDSKDFAYLDFKIYGNAASQLVSYVDRIIFSEDE